MREHFLGLAIKALFFLIFFSMPTRARGLDFDSFLCKVDLRKLLKDQPLLAEKNPPSGMEGAILVKNPLKGEFRNLNEKLALQANNLIGAVSDIQVRLAQTLDQFVEILPPEQNPAKTGMPGYKFKRETPINTNGLGDLFRNLSLTALSLKAAAKNFSSLSQLLVENAHTLKAKPIENLPKTLENLEALKTDFALLLDHVEKTLGEIENEGIGFDLLKKTGALNRKVSVELESMAFRFDEGLDRPQLLILALGNLFSSRQVLVEKLKNNSVYSELTLEILRAVDFFDDNIKSLAKKTSVFSPMDLKQIEIFLDSENSGLFPRFIQKFGKQVDQLEESSEKHELATLLLNLESEKKLIFLIVSEMKHFKSFSKLRETGQLNGDLVDVLDKISKAKEAALVKDLNEKSNGITATHKLIASFTVFSAVGGGALYYFFPELFTSLWNDK